MKHSMILSTLVLVLIMSASACSPNGTPVGSGETRAPMAPRPEGQDRGNGAEDEIPRHVGAAWFLGPEQTVRYCVEVDPGFFQFEKTDMPSIFKIVPEFRNKIEDSPKKVVREALDKWVHWVQSSGDYYYQKRRLATKFVERPCSESVDLSFYFGHDTPEIRNARERKRHPVAVAYETEADFKSGWRKGFIWVSQAGTHPIEYPARFFPNWTDEDQLFAIVLHEIGHVFGVDHVDGTIMANDIVGRIVGATDRSPGIDKETRSIQRAALRQINQQRMVLFPLDIAFEISGELGGARNLNPPFVAEGPSESALDVFNTLMSRKATGQIQAVLRGSDAYDLTLEIRDDLGTHAFPIEVRHLGEDRIQIFGPGRGAHIYQEGGSSSTTGSYGEVYSGTLKTFAGDERELIIQANPFNHNSYDMGPFRITLVGPGKEVKTLFRAGLIY